MNLKKIIIYEFENMFHILEELKEKLDLDLIKADSKNINEQINNSTSQYLIISKFKLDGFKNHLVLNNLPIKFEKLIELINLKFLKEIFNSQSDISVGLYKLNLNSRQMAKGDKVIDLTEREINLIIFLSKKKGASKIDELQKEVWDYNSELETHTVETHIYRLRKKIKDKFGDENFITSSKKGYSVI